MVTCPSGKSRMLISENNLFTSLKRGSHTILNPYVDSVNIVKKGTVCDLVTYQKLDGNIAVKYVECYNIHCNDKLGGT